MTKFKNLLQLLIEEFFFAVQLSDNRRIVKNFLSPGIFLTFY